MFQAVLRRALPYAAAVIAAAAMFSASPAQAQYGRQYYTTWSYYPTQQYYYTYYRYQTVVDAPTYDYHYCVYYPTRRYVYYYNPVRRVYWGRYDLEKQGYSMLEEMGEKQKSKPFYSEVVNSCTGMPEAAEAAKRVK